MHFLSLPSPLSTEEVAKILWNNKKGGKEGRWHNQAESFGSAERKTTICVPGWPPIILTMPLNYLDTGVVLS